MGRSKAINWLLVFLWMIVIFIFSHQPSTISSEMSHGVLDKIMDVRVENVPVQAEYLDIMHTIIRKMAHLTIYFVLGALVLNAVHSESKNLKEKLLITFIICCLYAIGDEYHQTFIAGRSGEFRDVVIDSMGALCGSITCWKIVG